MKVSTNCDPSRRALDSNNPLSRTYDQAAGESRHEHIQHVSTAQLYCHNFSTSIKGAKMEHHTYHVTKEPVRRRIAFFSLTNSNSDMIVGGQKWAVPKVSGGGVVEQASKQES